MKQSLLELTIDVLDAIDGDEVNSISDSTESLQISNLIKNVYYDLIGRKDWQFLRKLKSFDSVSDTNRPTHLKIPDNTSKLEFLNYNKRKVVAGRNFFQPINFRYPDEFLLAVNQRDNTLSNYTTVTDFDGVVLTIRTDEHPSYFTSFDDKYIVMDSYDSSIESTLQGSNTQAALFVIPVWSATDAFIPDLPAEMFPQFLAECKTYAIAKNEDNLSQKTEQTAIRHQRHLSQTHGVVQGGVRYPDYGRNPRKVSSGSTRSPLFGPLS